MFIGHPFAGRSDKPKQHAEDRISPTRLINTHPPTHNVPPDGHSPARKNDTVPISPTQQQLAHIHQDRDAFVARWLKDHPNLDLREALSTAFSAGATAALTHAG